jgi:hypothetical protein
MSLLIISKEVHPTDLSLGGKSRLDAPRLSLWYATYMNCP